MKFWIKIDIWKSKVHSGSTDSYKGEKKNKNRLQFEKNMYLSKNEKNSILREIMRVLHVITLYCVRVKHLSPIHPIAIFWRCHYTYGRPFVRNFTPRACTVYCRNYPNCSLTDVGTMVVYIIYLYILLCGSSGAMTLD